MAEFLPAHLKRYVVKQDYSRYTWTDQAVWRFIMRRLKDYLSQTAHESYLDGLEKTGISTEEIPKIDVMSEMLKPYGWRAVAVSGFIPPAAFMELQSLGVLPIACDMRSIEHTMYTPAPDIVHEAAGHAPILIQPDFARYLREYAQAAKKAIINKEDLDVYEAIRVLSDLKEDPNSTEEQIKAAEEQLHKVQMVATQPSEASLLARMNWWTAEYGLIGDIQNPKIYGAGLLSSIGESVTALENKTKKIPFSLKCLDFTYDITEPQPQLFVAPNFDALTQALNEFSSGMAYKTGGISGLTKAIKSKIANTVELDTGLQISGILKEVVTNKNGSPIYVIFEGPTQISVENKELPGHGTSRHKEGFGAPLGKFKILSGELKQSSLVHLHFSSGIELKGTASKIDKLIYTFTDCKVSYENRVLFDPAWGEYDMILGSEVTSVFGGAADRLAYGETQDFASKVVIPPKRSEAFKELDNQFKRLRALRTQPPSKDALEAELTTIINILNKNHPTEWLTRLEILEICVKFSVNPNGLDSIQDFIARLSSNPSQDGQMVLEGFRLIEKGV